MFLEGYVLEIQNKGGMMSREYTSARCSPQLLPRCGQVWALYFLFLVLPHSAMWGVLFLFPEEKRPRK